MWSWHASVLIVGRWVEAAGVRVLLFGNVLRRIRLVVHVLLLVEGSLVVAGLLSTPQVTHVCHSWLLSLWLFGLILLGLVFHLLWVRGCVIRMRRSRVHICIVALA